MDPAHAYIYVLEEIIADLRKQLKRVEEANAYNKMIKDRLDGALFYLNCTACYACEDIGYIDNFIFVYCSICQDYDRVEVYCESCAKEHVIMCESCMEGIINDHEHAKVDKCPACGETFYGPE